MKEEGNNVNLNNITSCNIVENNKSVGEKILHLYKQLHTMLFTVIGIKKTLHCRDKCPHNMVYKEEKHLQQYSIASPVCQRTRS